MKNNKKHFQKLFAIITCLGVIQGTIDLPKTSEEQKITISREEKLFLIEAGHPFSGNPEATKCGRVYLTQNEQKQIIDKKISDDLASKIEACVPRYYVCKPLIKTDNTVIVGDSLILHAIRRREPFYVEVKMDNRANRGLILSESIIVTKLDPNIDEQITLSAFLPMLSDKSQIKTGYCELEEFAQQFRFIPFAIQFGSKPILGCYGDLKEPADRILYNIRLHEEQQFFEKVKVIKDLANKTGREINDVIYFLDVLSSGAFEYAIRTDSRQKTRINITKHNENTYSIDLDINYRGKYIELANFFFKKEGSDQLYTTRGESNKQSGNLEDVLRNLLQDCPISEMSFHSCKLGDKTYESKAKGAMSLDLILNILKAMAGNIQIDFTVRWYDRMLDHYNGLDLEEILGPVDK